MRPSRGVLIGFIVLIAACSDAASPANPPVVPPPPKDPPPFDLVVRWLTEPSSAARAALAAAETSLEQVIVGDLPDESVVNTPVCPLPGAGPSATINETVDDVVILALVGPMDGPGGAGAQGFPCLIRDPGTQTVVGFVRMDEAEFGSWDGNVQREVALHEMLHALGIAASLFNITTPSGFSRRCLALPSTGVPNVLVQDSHFTCANARAAFDAIGGGSYGGAKVPLENGATRALTSSTLNQHWRKTTFVNELMTGWFGVARAPMSAVTVGALADLGYTVAIDKAESFTLPMPVSQRQGPLPALPARASFLLGEPPIPFPPRFTARGAAPPRRSFR